MADRSHVPCVGKQSTLGIIMLDTAFARPVGDAGNPLSWPFPVLIERVTGAHARAVVDATFADVAVFVAAGERLVARGAIAVITTCGFLARYQPVLAQALPVPVAASTLIRFGRVQQRIGSARPLAILSISSASLDAEVRRAANIDDHALVYGLPPGSHFVRAILDQCEALDVERASEEWVALALQAQRENPSIGGWLFECANMPPYAAAVVQATGLPVYDVLTLGRELFASATAQ